MKDLPRSRALVRQDGPGHILPVEPVTPPGSAVWRIVHFPVMLASVAIGLLAAAALAVGLIGYGFRLFAHVPAVRFLVPLVGAMAITTGYFLFVRIVERRSDIEELSTREGLTEFGLGAGGGLGLSIVTFALLSALGNIRVTGFNSPDVMLLPFVVQLCTAVILEIVICGLGFRLVERFLGSWLALLLTAGFFGALRLGAGNVTFFAVFAVALDAALLFAIVYMVTRRLWAAIGLHSAWKFGQIGLYGDAVSAGEPQGLVRVVVNGPDWITGGISGTAASLPALFLTVLMVLALLTVAVRRGRIVRPAWQRSHTA